jgi:Domain of unknown function (DUF4253)
MPDSWALPGELPPGQTIVPDPRHAIGSPVTDPVLWISDQPAPGAGPLWARLLGQYPDTGLWPLLLTELPAPHFTGTDRLPPEAGPLLERAVRAGRPWHTGELAPVRGSDASTPDACTLLARRWNQVTGQGEFDFGEDAIPAVPFRSWPGPAAPGIRGADPGEHAARIASTPGGLRELTGRDDRPFLGLVPSGDSAGAITACGWKSQAGAPAEIAAIVRSWHQRFGARLCSLGFDTLGVSVAWPPLTSDHARHVAAEHLAFCSDLAGTVTFDQYARELIGAPAWRFWWD